jgi:hypothetical protein|tara:strand:+ start:312 stop:503 length:192 start_codon:yes stop_codon:yes gene_type:complete
MLLLTEEEIDILDKGLYALQNTLARKCHKNEASIDYYNTITNIRVKIMKSIQGQAIKRAFHEK